MKIVSFYVNRGIIGCHKCTECGKIRDINRLELEVTADFLGCTFGENYVCAYVTHAQMLR